MAACAACYVNLQEWKPRALVDSVELGDGRQGFVVFSLLDVGVNHHVGAGETRLHVEHGGKLRDGEIVLAGKIEVGPAIRADDEREWVQFAGAFNFDEGFVKAS